MKKEIIIFGAGGFGREVAVLLKQINSNKDTWNLVGYVDDDPLLLNTYVNGIPVIGNSSYLVNRESEICVAVALSHQGRERAIKALLLNRNLQFPNLIWPGLFLDESIILGRGNLICHGALMTCNIEIGNFNIFNGHTGTGHDCKIGDYNLFGPKSFIAGEVTIGKNNIFSMNSAVIQQKTIGDNNVINMNSVIIRNITDGGVYFGIPATKQTF